MERRRSAVPEPAWPGRLVPVGGKAVAAGEARADGDVADAGPHALQQPHELLHGMLAVGVHAARRTRIRAPAA